jgi:hypothetical protein
VVTVTASGVLARIGSRTSENSLLVTALDVKGQDRAKQSPLSTEQAKELLLCSAIENEGEESVGVFRLSLGIFSWTFGQLARLATSSSRPTFA